MKNFIYAISLFLPWFLRRRVLEAVFGYRLHPSSRMGFAWVCPKQLTMEEGAYIGHLTVCKGLEFLWLKRAATIGKGNWITGFPLNDPNHFGHEPDRIPQLIVGDYSAITNRHIIDCTNSVTIGKFSTFAGFRSQILTHSIDLKTCRQSSAPIEIGDYCFLGTDCVMLGGSALPDYSVLGAKSLLNKRHEQRYTLYGGVPAKAQKILSEDMQYFSRTIGFVR